MPSDQSGWLTITNALMPIEPLSQLGKHKPVSADSLAWLSSRAPGVGLIACARTDSPLLALTGDARSECAEL